MAKNIYDLFNERKYGVDCLVEGYDFQLDDAPEYEDLDEVAEALNEITETANNEMIEMQAACYLEDLVIENMMFDDFDEEKIKSIMESSEEKKSSGIVEKIKNLWQKIKQWFVSAFKTITTHFQSGETLVSKYRKQIPAAMHQSKAKINIRLFKNPNEARKDMEYLVDRLKVVGQTKEQILSAAGVTDKKGMDERVDGWFYNSKEKKEQPINKLNPETVMDWASNKKVLMDALKKQQKDVDGEFKQILAEIKEGGDDNAEKAANFQFGIGLINAAFSRQVVCIKDLSNACTAILRKALSGNYDPKGPSMSEAPDVKDDRSAASRKSDEKFEKTFGKKAGAQNRVKKLGESWEIIDDDFEW